MSTLKYKNPETGAWEKVGIPHVDAYSKGETDALIAAASGVQMELLWENASPNSAFAGQTVTAPIVNYDEIKIISKIGVVTCTALHQSDCDGIMFEHDGMNYRRKFKINETSIIFEDCVEFAKYGDSSTATHNTCCVPYKIYGIKGVKENV